MDRYKRNCVLDIFDYNKRRICGLYDSSYDVSGQASDVVVTTERNGWRELSFTLPAVCETEDGAKENFRLQYLKADYQIRLIDDDGIDWFIISEPQISHQNFTRNVSVTAGHNSQLLKTKNLGQEFSDDEGNNVGTAEELQATILKGTGWKVGYVETFLDRNGNVKKRSMQAKAKTGAFKQITQMCDLFDAKPVFHGNEKAVDIVHMNPFSEPADGGLPDVTQADGVLELHYGQSVNNITRTLNTENLVTKLYAYGAYGDKTSGYCSIEECMHAEYIYTTTQAISAGIVYTFTPESYSTRHFSPSVDVPAGTRLIWSAMDPTSMMYIWDDGNKLAYPINHVSQTKYVDRYGNYIEDFRNDDSGEKTILPAAVEIVECQNWFSFLMDFSYYYHVGLLTDDMLQKLAQYQRDGAELYKTSHDAMSAYLDVLTDLTEIIGSVKFCKLNIASADSLNGYARLNLADEQVAYRSDYAEKERRRFSWTPATEITDKGDPMNDTASVIYIVHNTEPISWHKAYIQSFNDEIIDSQDGSEQKDITSIQLWSPAEDGIIQEDDAVYLFELNNINALLGSWEAADEAKTKTLEESTKVVTANHPVYFSENTLPVLDPTVINGYAWAWVYDPAGTKDSKLYFYYGDGSDGGYASSWAPVYFQGSVPPTTIQPAYWFNWAEMTGWDTSTLYALTSDGWVKATNDVITGGSTISGGDGLKDIPYDIEDVWHMFGTVYHSCVERDRQYRGYHNYTRYTIPDEGLLAGNYYFVDDYGDYYVFTTKENLAAGSTLTYDAFHGWIDQVTADGIKSTIETQKKPFDGVRYNNDEKNMIIIEKEHYRQLLPLESFGDLRGIIEFIRKFKVLSDDAYQEKLCAYLDAQAAIEELNDSMVEALGDLHREGWWQSEDYIDGDEEKLYEDALDNLQKISQPDASYTITYLDRYMANQQMEYAASDSSLGYVYPDVNIMSAVHLVDPEINVNVWAYIDKLSKCYDKAWKSSIAINTNLTAMTQHSFTDVLTNIANVAKEMKGKASVYDRAEVLTSDGKLAAERLQGEIDAAKLKIFGGNSTWYTDEAGNLMFVSADGTSAMTITGNGFAIASSKNEWGEWNWRTFGTGNGFTADEITTGFLSSDRIQANSISSYKLDTQTQNLLGWVEGAEVRLSPDNLKQTVTDTVESELHDANSSLRQSVIDQTASSIRMEFNEALTGLESMEEMQNNVNAWFDFSEDGLKIGAESQDGTESPFYTQQNNTEYGFYKENTKMASITGKGMEIPQVNVSTLFRLGNQYGIVGEDDAINWVYDPT